MHSKYDSKNGRGHHKSRGSIRFARLTIVVIFLLLLGIQLAALRFMPVSCFTRPEMVAETFLSTLWTGTLLGAIWKRNDWARYLLIVALLLTAVAALIFAPLHCASAPPTVLSKRLIVILAVYALGQISAALVLGRSPHINRLVSRSWE